jgi:UDP:flavonoid glycosyltransferase YjiC (YdhE family)
MSRFLFVTWNGGGNQPPAVGIAQELRERGHEVAFAGYESQRSRFLERGFDFFLLERSAAGLLDEPRDEWLGPMVRHVWASQEHLTDIPDIVARERPDALVVDCLMYGALVAAEDIGVPTAVLVHSGPGLLMPPGGPWDGLVLPQINELRAYRERPPVSNLWDIWAPFPTLCTTLAELDPLAEQVPASFEFVGPVFERVPPSGWRSPWVPDDPRPLVTASFSTTNAWDQTSRIQRTLDALAGSRYRVLVTTGTADVTGLSVPENAVLVAYVPHDEIMPHATVTITHAGHGTVAASLAHGLPLVCLPNRAADQPALAARVEKLGAGRALDGEAATLDDIAEAVNEVLTQISYVAAARRLAAEIAGMPGASIAATHLEALIGVMRYQGHSNQAKGHKLS